MSKKRTLIVSNNPISQVENNGKTIFNIFSRYYTSNLTQLFLKKHSKVTEYPINTIQLSFVSFKLVKSKITKRLGDCLIKAMNSDGIKRAPKVRRQFGRSTLLLFARDILFFPILTMLLPYLMRYLRKNNYERIFYVYSDFLMLNIFLLVFSKLNSNISVDVFFTDDYFFKPLENDVKIRSFYSNLLMMVTKRLVEKSGKRFGISEKMNRIYGTFFKKNFALLINPQKICCSPKDGLDFSQQKKIKIRYFGSLHSGRKAALFEFSSLIKEAALNVEFSIDVFTSSSLSQNEKDQLDSLNVRILPVLSGERFYQEVCRSDVLLLLESFEIEHLGSTWLSCSTKVPEYLSSGKVIFAYGPLENPSIEIIKNNNCGLVFGRGSQLRVSDVEPMKLDRLIRNAAATYRRLFSITEITKRIS